CRLPLTERLGAGPCDYSPCKHRLPAVAGFHKLVASAAPIALSWLRSRLKTRRLVMRKWKIWLVIALGILGGLVAWALLGRNLWNVRTASVGSATLGSATQEPTTNNVCGCDTSGHKVSFVMVE